MYIHIPMYVCMYIHTYVRMYVRMYIHIPMYVCMYIHTYVRMYVRMVQTDDKLHMCKMHVAHTELCMGTSVHTWACMYV